MDRVDLTRAALDALQPAAKDTTTVGDLDEARRIRGKLLGVLIRKCRLIAERTVADCAYFLGADPGLIESWEYGESIPSLPQLELLANYLNGHGPLVGDGALAEDQAAQDEYMLLRQRIIGALLRAARVARGLSLTALSESAGLEADQLAKFEFGEETIPISDLTALAQALGMELSYFSALPRKAPEQSRLNNVPEAPLETSTEWRAFTTDSENLPFIRLAMAFQHIARDDLHRIADALLAIIRANGDSNGWPAPSS